MCVLSLGGDLRSSIDVSGERGKRYEVEFILNQEYNDGFKIKYQRKIDE